MKLPTHMAKNQTFIKNRTTPTNKVFVGWGVIRKIKALYCHRSQLHGFKKAMPKVLPLWFFISLSIYEYFHEVKT